MPPPDPWAFGLNQLLTVIGLLITVGIATAGFRSFEKWKREKIEERRIDIALEALSVAYEARFIFDSIRSPMSYEAEWKEMQGIEDPGKRLRAGPFFAVLKRLEHHYDYFGRVWKLQPRFMAMFGKDAADVFMKLHAARREIEVSAGMLMHSIAREEPFRDDKFRKQLENDVSNIDHGADRIKPKVDAFIEGIEKHCQPVVAHRYTK